MRIPSGKTDQVIFFVAIDSSDLSRKTGLSSFTVYRSRKGGTATVYTTPTVAELSSANMPGVYSLLIDEDTTIDSGSDSEEYCVHVTATGMVGVTRTFELYRRDTTSGRTLDVSSGGEAGLDWANVGSPTTAVDLSGTTIKTTQKVDVDTIKTNPVVNGGTVTFPTGATLASTTNISAGTVTTATNVTTVNGLAAGVITAASIAADAITAAKVADGAIDAATFASGALDAVWSTATRVLTAGTNIALAKGTGVTGFNDLSAAQVNAEADTALADYDGPTHAEMTAELATADDATLAAIAALNNLSAAGVRTELATELARIDAAISSRSTYAGTDTSGTTTLLSRLTAIRAALIDNLDAAISTRLAAAGYTAPDNSSVTAIKAKTDQLAFTVPNFADVNIQYVNDVAVGGIGTSGSPWGPA